MAEVFLRIVNMSISASWLVLAILILRFFLKKAPKWVNVLLWGIVAVRLLCPVSIESALSLIPSVETISPEIMMDRTPQITTGIYAINSVVNPIISESFAPEPTASANPLQIWIPVISVIWVIGIAAMLIYTAVSYFRLHGKVRTAVWLYENIYQSAHIPSPFVLGFIKPRIYLPFGMEATDMAHVIAHERTHIRRRDHWWKPLGFLLLAIHWFNPLMWAAYILLCRDIELACDEKVIEELGRDQRADYSQALLTCSVNRRMIAACPLAFGEVGVKARVKNVLSYKKPALWVIVLALILCAAVAVSMLTDPIPKTTPYAVFSTLDADDVQWAQATIWNVPAGDHVMLNDNQIDELVTILKSIEDDDFEERNRADNGVSIMIHCGDSEILLTSSGEYVHFAFDTETAETLGNISWGVKHDALNAFISDILSMQTVAREWVDFDKAETYNEDGTAEATLPQFPGVTFRCDYGYVTAETEGEETILIDGMPIWNVCFADLNGDWQPEICATVSFGSGLVDSHVVVYDYANGQEYTLWERGEYDYYLRLKDGRLMCDKHAYASGGPMDKGELLESGELILADHVGGDGRSLIIDAYTMKETVMVPTDVDIHGVFDRYLYRTIDGNNYRYERQSAIPEGVVAGEYLETLTAADGLGTTYRWEVYAVEGCTDDTMVIAQSPDADGVWLYQYSPSKRADEGALQAARDAGYVIEEEGRLTGGQDAWYDFYETTQKGSPASVKVVHYYTLDPKTTADITYEAYREDYPMLFILDLSYDGKVYTLRWNEYGTEYVRTYEYLMKYTGKTPAASYTEYTHYVLTHDRTVTWEQLFSSMTSSVAGAYIDHHTICSERY